MAAGAGDDIAREAYNALQKDASLIEGMVVKTEIRNGIVEAPTYIRKTWDAMMPDRF